MPRLWCLVVIGPLAVVVSLVGAGPALAAKGGNNDTAKACQKGGWKALVPDSGGTFANQGDCVNDGAQGSAPFGTAGQAACDKVRGAFIFDPGGPQWSCLWPSGSGGFVESLRELATACATDTTGSPNSTFDNKPLGSGQPQIFQATCNLIM